MDLWVGIGAAGGGAATMRDNGVAAVDADGVVFAVSEERLSRVKQDTGHARSLAALERHIAGMPAASPPRAPAGPAAGALAYPLAYALGPDGAHRLPDHHLGHALVAHAMSPFGAALSIVADTGDAAATGQTSIWRHQDGREPSLLWSEQTGPEDLGPGRWYQAITDHLDWDTHGLPGNTMALAGYGGEELLAAPRLWDDPTGTFDGRLRARPGGASGLVADLWALLARTVGSGLPEPDSHRGRAALARYLQASLEDYLASLVDRARAATGIAPVCLGGGVALNCVAAAALVARGGGPVYVGPVPANVGQPLAAALWARAVATGWHTKVPEAVFLGPVHDLAAQARAVADPRPGGPLPPDTLADYLAARIAAGGVVAVCQGRGEFGARALGHRSVLCDPCRDDAVRRVKTGVKRREEFMPLAPVALPQVLAGHDLPWSHTMSLAPRLPAALHAEFGHTVHVDGTARLQIAHPGSLVERVLRAFEGRTGRRVLVNTSFNRRGHPIAETGADAVAAWRELDIDVLAVAGHRYE